MLQEVHEGLKQVLSWMKLHFKLMTTSIITTAKYEHCMNTESTEMTKIRNVVQITAKPYDKT